MASEKNTYPVEMEMNKTIDYTSSDFYELFRGNQYENILDAGSNENNLWKLSNEAF